MSADSLAPPPGLWIAQYNTIVVLLGTGLLGLAAGVVGSFLLLRKRALLGDALSHATLPGIAGAFLVMVALGGAGKWLPGLLAGAAISGALGVTMILAIVHTTRIKEDAALGIVLSVFFGVGVVLLSLIQNLPTGSAAGLESFIYGKTASMLAFDAWLIGIAAAVVLVLCALLFKELKLLCFDGDFAGSLGWPVVVLDVVLMAMVVAVTVIGLQAVGLILVIALLIIPASAARFWTERLGRMTLLAGVLGAASGLGGAAASAVFPRLPAGAMIVLVAGGLFALSMLLGGTRGVLAQLWRQRAMNRRIGRQNLLRTLYEWHEQHRPIAAAGDPTAEGLPPIDFRTLRRRRGWNYVQLQAALAAAMRAGLVVRRGGAEHFALTTAGLLAARQVVRNHRLWEMYLITHADVAPGHVDREADRVEHVLGADLVARLEHALVTHDPAAAMPDSPHQLPANGTAVEEAP